LATTRRNTSQRLTLIILLLASITAITLDYRGSASRDIGSLRNAALDVISPIQRVVSAALRPVGNFFSGAVNYGSAVAENARLQNEIGALRRQVLENAQAEHQLQQILSEQHLSFVQNIPTELAEVISGASSNFELTFEINRGTSSGVSVGMPVVSGAGLVGDVISAGTSTAVVQLVTDQRSSVGVTFGPSSSVAVAVGQGAGEPLSLTGVTASMSPKVGERVYTSGLATLNTFPGGIPVGYITSVSPPNGSLTRTVLVQPYASFSNLQYVSVMQWLPPA
jgi:rod shape-determining protein MreC